jgi:hypothetical protein
MYPPEDSYRLANLVRDGLLDLRHLYMTTFDLDQANDAVADAAANAGLFTMTVVRP